MNRFIALIILVLIQLCTVDCTAREELWQQELDYQARNNINNLIKGLDSPFEFRVQYIRKLVEMADSGNRDLVMSVLKETLSKNNMQISEGVTEIFARVADPEVIPTLQDELLYNPYLDVRRSIIIHLPAFCITDVDKRYEIVNMFEDSEFDLPPRLLGSLREPPVSNITGEYDSTVEEATRIRVETSLAWQLEPVEAVINFGLENDNQERALKILTKMLGVDIGHNKNSWVEFWRSRGRTYVSPIQDEIFETQVLSCKMLANLGAEGTELLMKHVMWNMSTPYNTIRQAVLAMLFEITEYSNVEVAEHAVALEAGINFQPEKLWRERKIESNARLKDTIFLIAKQYLGDKDFDIRVSIVDCLGATHSLDAVTYIKKALRRDSQSQQMRLHIAKALGKIGGEEAVRILKLMVEYRGIAVKHELQVQEYKRVVATLEALGEIVKIGINNKKVEANVRASEEALSLILLALQDDREFSGASGNLKGDKRIVKYYARNVMQRMFNNSSMSYDPKVWKDVFDSKMTGNK